MTRSSENNVSIVETLFVPDYRVRLMTLLGSRFATKGLAAFGGGTDELWEDGEAAVDAMLSMIAEAINTEMGGGETAVAFFSVTDPGAYVAGSSGGHSGPAWGDRLMGIREMITSTTLPALDGCIRIGQADNNRTATGEAGQGEMLAAPMFTGDRLIGVVAVSQGEKPEFSTRDESRLALAAVLLSSTAQQVTSEATNEQRLHSLAHALSATLDARDPNTRGHSNRVAMYAMAILNEMGHTGSDRSWCELRNRIRVAALLHDIGKVGIPDSILLKDDALTDEEYERVKQHPVMGTEILTACYGLKDLVPGVLYHHERFDGSGYPFGLEADEIPFMARVIALADAFDAMTSDRPFRAASSHGEAIEILKGGTACNFEPVLLDALLRAHEKGTLKYVRLPSATIALDALAFDDVERFYGPELEGLPSLPDVLATVNSLLDDPGTSLKKIAGVLSTDEGLASRVLRLVNSAYYGLPRMVSTIPLATTILGAKAIKSHVVNIAYADLMGQLGGRHEQYNLLWRHGLRTATWARAIAGDLHDVDPEEAFTAGLIHDIGKAICLRLRGESYAKIIEEAYRSGRPLVGVEEEVVGFNHSQIGGWAASRWSLPESLVNAIGWHHNPSVLKGRSEDIHNFVVVIHIADIAARAVGATSLDFTPFMLVELCPTVLRDLGSEYVADLESIKSKVGEAERELEATFAETCVG
jgi:putative nucleotidyltransferase with HDIG domain